jgi:hypothetical protein
MNISYIGHTTFPTPKRSILLKDILYVPRTKKNLASIYCLSTNNSISIELHPTFFLIKDRKTRTTLLRGRCIGAFYPLPMSAIKEVCNARKSSINTLLGTGSGRRECSKVGGVSVASKNA